MWHPGTDTGSLDPFQGVEEQTVSSPVLSLTGTTLSQNVGIPVSGGNPASYVRAAGNGSTPSAHPDWQPSLVSLMFGTEGVPITLGFPASVGNPRRKCPSCQQK